MLELNLSQNTNSNIQANGYNPVGKYYARVEPKEQYDLTKLAEHMHEHNAAFSEGIITGVLTDMVKCIKHLVLAGNSVKIPNLGIFKASVEANGLTLSAGAKVSAGQGSQRSDAELNADITKQQFAVGCVKLIMQASGDMTKDVMSGKAKLTFTSKTKELIKSKTGNAATGDNAGGDDNNGGDDNGGDDNNGGGQQATVEAPVINGENPFAESTEVSISGPAEATIYFTENGETPTTSDSVYSAPFTINEATTIKAIAVLNGVSSAVTTRAFTKSSGGSGGGSFDTGS